MNVKPLMAVSLLLCLLFCHCLPLRAAEMKGRWGVGLNSPGVGVRYCAGNRTAVELRGQFENDISVYGLRGYYYFSRGKRLQPFAGIEADIVSFKGTASEGSGIAGELCVGGEYFVASRLSLQMDLGPAFVSLNDNGSSQSVSGLEYVVNFGINYYFGELFK